MKFASRAGGHTVQLGVPTTIVEKDTIIKSPDAIGGRDGFAVEFSPTFIDGRLVQLYDTDTDPRLEGNSKLKEKVEAAMLKASENDSYMGLYEPPKERLYSVEAMEKERKELEDLRAFRAAYDAKKAEKDAKSAKPEQGGTT